MRGSLLESQGLNRVESRGLAGGIEAEKHADGAGETKCEEGCLRRDNDAPPGNSSQQHGASVTGEDADQRRAEIQTQLAWSEGYEVEITPDTVRLKFAEATEECADELKKSTPTRTVQQLLQTGELVSILE